MSHRRVMVVLLTVISILLLAFTTQGNADINRSILFLPLLIYPEQPTQTPTPTQILIPDPTATSTTSPNCDPSYPTVCIPPPPPDLDCNDIPYRNFKVYPPDPHNFDRDLDGIGCES